MNIVFLGIDLAKNVFALHGVNRDGKPVLVCPAVHRDQLLRTVAELPPCTIGMEACSGAHHWAREFSNFGHTVWLMAPKFVAPFRMSGRRGKNDAADAAAVCGAMQRAAMRFVPVKSLLAEFGVVLPLKAQTVRRQAAEHLEHLPGWMRTVGHDLLDEMRRLDERIASYDDHIRLIARAEPRSQQLMTIPGIGATTASALLAHIGHGQDFAGGRQLVAWLGLAPSQYSSGGKTRLGRITKAGDGYLRSLLILGARAVLAAATNKHDRLSRWAVALAERRGYWKAVVAVAAKNVSIAWAMLTRGEDFRPATGAA